MKCLQPIQVARVVQLFGMRRSCVQSQGLLFLLAQLKERGRDTKEWTWGEQDRTEEAHQPRNRNCIYSFMWGVITGAVPEPNKRTSGSVCFWPNHQKQNTFPLAGPVSTAQPWHSPKDFLHWHLILFTDQSGTSKGWSFWFSLTVFISFYTQQITQCVSVNIFTLNISFIKIWSKLSVHFSEQYISKDMSPSQIVSQIIWYASGKAQLIKVGLSLTDISSLL